MLSSLSSLSVDICSSTIRTRLINAGLPACRPRKKAKITRAMAKKRVNWAHEVKSRFRSDWSKVSNLNISIVFLTHASLNKNFYPNTNQPMFLFLSYLTVNFQDLFITHLPIPVNTQLLYYLLQSVIAVCYII